MSLSEAFLLIVRWLHLVSAAAWVGGSIFYLVVLRPAQRRSPNASSVLRGAATEFRALVDTCIYVLIATGIILTLNRLTPGVVGAPYVIALGAKIALSVWMFTLAWSRRRRTPGSDASRGAEAPAETRLSKTLRAVSGYNALVILGLIVFLISDLLKVLYEMVLR